MSSVRALVAGGNSSYFIRDDGSLWAAGDNDDGQLGNGSQVSTPVAAQVATAVVQVSANSGYAVFVREDGSLWGMGRNDHGQLGVPPAVMARALHPIPIANSGGWWACGLYPDRRLAVGSCPE
ncbi:MAG: hypothetical protein IPN11_03195 [Opitutaceae bacterium]|nr:hypothetical protein [Opitutaceae bacterium]